MNLLKNIFTVLLVLVLTSTAVMAQSAYKIIVNSDNPVTSLTKTQVQRFFLKKATRWEDGTKVNPVDLKAASAVRIKFTEDLLKKSVPAVKSYWQGQIFSGSGLPPQEVDSNKAVMEWVKNNPGGIGYISQSTATISGVKAVTVK